jgi:hypothetical protein
MLNAAFNTSLSQVRASVKDINGNPLPGITVNFVIGNNPYGNLTLNRYYDNTDTSGAAYTNCTAGLGTVKIISGKLSPAEIPVAAA